MNKYTKLKKLDGRMASSGLKTKKCNVGQTLGDGSEIKANKGKLNLVHFRGSGKIYLDCWNKK